MEMVSQYTHTETKFNLDFFHNGAVTTCHLFDLQHCVTRLVLCSDSIKQLSSCYIYNTCLLLPSSNKQYTACVESLKMHTIIMYLVKEYTRDKQILTMPTVGGGTTII